MPAKGRLQQRPALSPQLRPLLVPLRLPQCQLLLLLLPAAGPGEEAFPLVELAGELLHVAPALPHREALVPLASASYCSPNLEAGVDAARHIEELVALAVGAILGLEAELFARCLGRKLGCLRPLLLCLFLGTPAGLLLRLREASRSARFFTKICWWKLGKVPSSHCLPAWLWAL